MDEEHDKAKVLKVAEHGTRPDLLCIEYNPIETRGKLPFVFCMKHIKNVPPKVRFKDPRGNELIMGLTIEGDNVFIGEGWSHLAELYGVKQGGWVYLRYVSLRKFDMEVTNLKGDKVTYHDRGSTLPKNDYANPIIIDAEDEFEAEETNPHIVDRSNMITAVKKLLTYREITGTTLGFTKNWCQHALPISDGPLSLVDEYGTLWPCHYTTDLGDGQTSGICRGWRKFVIKKKLFQGQTVKFGVMNTNSNHLYFTPSG